MNFSSSSDVRSLEMITDLTEQSGETILLFEEDDIFGFDFSDELSISSNKIPSASFTTDSENSSGCFYCLASDA